MVCCCEKEIADIHYIHRWGTQAAMCLRSSRRSACWMAWAFMFLHRLVFLVLWVHSGYIPPCHILTPFSSISLGLPLPLLPLMLFVTIFSNASLQLIWSFQLHITFFLLTLFAGSHYLYRIFASFVSKTTAASNFFLTVLFRFLDSLPYARAGMI